MQATLRSHETKLWWKVTSVRQLTLMAAGAMAGVMLMSGCASSSPKAAPLTTDSPIFDGLPKEVVTEVLASPGRGGTIREAGEYRDAGAQGAVRDFIMCRDIYRVYRTWVSTGQPPKPTPLVIPANPVELSDKWTRKAFAEFVTAVESGDPSDLKTMITANGGCGSDVPLKPGDFSGPTLADAVKNL